MKVSRRLGVSVIFVLVVLAYSLSSADFSNQSVVDSPSLSGSQTVSDKEFVTSDGISELEEASGGELVAGKIWCYPRGCGRR